MSQAPKKNKNNNSNDSSDSNQSRGSFKKSSHNTQDVNELLERHVPPHSVTAEQAVIAGIFLSPEMFTLIGDTLSEDDFYIPAHKTLYATFLALFNKGQPIDLVTVGQYLADKNLLENIGGAVYLAELQNQVLSAANAEHYANIVREKAMQRGLISTCAGIIANAYDSSQDVKALLDESEQSVLAISSRTSGKSFVNSKDLVRRVFDDIKKRSESKEMITGVSTGYTQLDKMTAGLQASDLIILAARPSMGKTAFALNIAMRAATSNAVPVAVFSLEMSMEQLMMRMLCAYGKIGLSKLRNGFLDDDDWNRLVYAADILERSPIFIDDTPALSTLELRARARRLKLEKGLGLVVIDYLQLMRASRRVDSRELEISEISRSLKALAKELQIPVIALAQLNRKVEERADKRPILSDLRESGAIEQDADIIMFIYRDEVYNKREDNPRKGLAEIIIGKQRNGPIGTVDLAYAARYTAFEDLDPSFVPPPSENRE